MLGGRGRLELWMNRMGEGEVLTEGGWRRRSPLVVLGRRAGKNEEERRSVGDVNQL